MRGKGLKIFSTSKMEAHLERFYSPPGGTEQSQDGRV